MRLPIRAIGCLLSLSTILLLHVRSDKAKTGHDNTCITKETCGECLAEHSQCAWCSQENFTERGFPRCDLIHNLRGNCSGDKITWPVTTLLKLKDTKLSDKGVREEDAIQIKPQEIKLTLRPNTPVTFTVEFRQSVDYPVDLYYVMDLSYSMKDDKVKLAELGGKLAQEMSSITSNFKLGFGSFIDKFAAPYINVHPYKLKKPCADCAKSYGFQNNMPLSLETYEFAKNVNNSFISGNLDGVEGGFDAIMQAVVCKDEIAWRDKSRKLLVFSTDSGFHHAGDGKLAGITLPNDGNCHLDSDGFYTMTAVQDYPSLSQLNNKIKDHKVNIIFAVTRDQINLYKELSKRLVGSITGILKGDSSNIVQLIRNQYNKLTSSVEMTDSSKSGNIQVTYQSSCLGDKKQKTNVCNGLKVGTTVSFDITVEVSFCPTRKHEWNQTFQIYPIGLNEFLTVHLEMICECECEKSWNEERFSPRCNAGNGTYECGVCSCYDNKYGKECECDYRDRDPFVADASCLYGDDVLPCSDHGICRCGKCNCMKRPNPEEKIYGKFCQCDNFSCDKKNGKLCSGADRGLCDCGKCKCLNGWSGDDCSCSGNTDNCIDSNGVLCGNHGYCKCDSCVCNSTSQEYFGRFCDDCMTCPEKCNDLRFCIECFLANMHKSVTTTNNCSLCDIDVLPVDKLEVQASEMEKLCSYEDPLKCLVSFKYKMNEQNQLLVHVQKNRECPEPVNVMAIVSGVAGGVVGAGLLILLLWKILTEIHDHQEFARYKKDLEQSKWDAGENPIYKPSTSTFQNPAYGQH